MASADNRCRRPSATASFASSRANFRGEQTTGTIRDELQVAHLAQQLKRTNLEEAAGRMLLASEDQQVRGKILPSGQLEQFASSFSDATSNAADVDGDQQEDHLVQQMMQTGGQYATAHQTTNYYHQQDPFEASYATGNSFNESHSSSGGAYYATLGAAPHHSDFLGQLEPVAPRSSSLQQESDDESEPHYANLDSCYHYHHHHHHQTSLPDSVVQLNYQHHDEFSVVSSASLLPTITATVTATNPNQQSSASASGGSSWDNSTVQTQISVSGGSHHHDANQDNNNEPELKVCEWEGCGNTFIDMGEFVKHLEEAHVNQLPREKNRYYCLWAQCKRNEQEFNARYKLLIHMRVHSGEKPYPCPSDNCNKSFSRLENLKIHQRSHTGEKPYKCNFRSCPKSFTNSSDRIKHHKTHQDPKPYSCSYQGCSKRYTDPSSLRKHLRAHKRQQQQQQADEASVEDVDEHYLQPQRCLQTHSPYLADDQHLLNLNHHQNRPIQARCQSTTVPSQQYLAPQQLHCTSSSDTGHAHAQFSRSWCAGTTPSSLNEASLSRPPEQHSTRTDGSHNQWPPPAAANATATATTTSYSGHTHHYSQSFSSQPLYPSGESPYSLNNHNFNHHRQPQGAQQQHHYNFQTHNHQRHEALMLSLPPIGGASASFRAPSSSTLRNEQQPTDTWLVGRQL